METQTQYYYGELYCVENGILSFCAILIAGAIVNVAVRHKRKMV